jgi:hypothetical protein
VQLPGAASEKEANDRAKAHTGELIRLEKIAASATHRRLEAEKALKSLEKECSTMRKYVRFFCVSVLHVLKTNPTQTPTCLTQRIVINALLQANILETVRPGAILATMGCLVR